MPACLTSKTCLKPYNDSSIKAVYSFIPSKKNYKIAARYSIKVFDSCKLSIQSFNNDIESYSFAFCYLINCQGNLYNKITIEEFAG